MAAKRNPNAPRGVTPLTLDDLEKDTPMEVVIHFRTLEPSDQPMMFLEFHRGSPDSHSWVLAQHPSAQTRTIFLDAIGVCAAASGRWAETYVVRA